MDGVIIALLCVGCAGLGVLFFRLAYRVCRLEQCLLKAADCRVEP